VLIRGATVVEPATETSERRDLIVHGGRLCRGPAGGPDDAGVDATGLYALPGLIDAHVHLSPFPVRGTPVAGPVVGDAVASLRTAAAAGVTAVRDLGADLTTALAARAIAADEDFPGSRALVAGPMLSVPSGHGTASYHGVALGNAREAAAMTRVLCDAGVDQVKVATSGASGRTQMPRDVMEAIFEVAHERGKPVAVHAHLQPEQIAAAVELGARSIEHGFLLHSMPDTLTLMASRGTFLCPTLRVVQAVREHATSYGQRIIPAAWEDALATVRAAASAGVRIVAGTDGGAFGVTSHDVWAEMALIAEQTGSRWDGLRAATCEAAAAVGRSELGSLCDEALADIVLLRRDPLEGDTTASDVVAVLRAGRLVCGRLE